MDLLVLGEGALEVLDVLDGLEDDVELAEAEAGEAGRQQGAQLVQLRRGDRLGGEVLQLGEAHVVHHPVAASCQTGNRCYLCEGLHPTDPLLPPTYFYRPPGGWIHPGVISVAPASLEHTCGAGLAPD